MYAELFSIIAPVFICAGIGFGWAKTGRPYDTELVTTLVTTVGGPCLIFNTLANIAFDGGALLSMAGATLATIVVFGLVGLAVLRLLGLSLRTFLPALMFPNAGNMGIPLSYLAFGDVGLAFGIAAFTVHSVLQFTLGVALASGSASLKALARVPLIYAVVLAVAFLALDIRPPEWLNNTTKILAGLTIPMMLITLGISLARLAVTRMSRSLGLSVLRLVMGFLVGLGVAQALGLEGAARGVLILDSAMPAAVFNYLFAQRYNNAPEEVAGIVVISTALAFLILPALMWFVL
ncbi:MAG: AEC family transporter [Rhodobacterales bacterium]|nr:AEC family transporter [Rhodobacterales bacterium]